ncbi:MAG: hypothetical protein EP332_03600 [Bacteroidetes bacterium]|nr:MAG: hypothetical protein EP332_03600 [Bacteroidota bacterium]
MKRVLLGIVLLLPLVQSCKQEDPPGLDIFLQVYTLGGAARFSEGINTGEQTLIPVAVQDANTYKYALLRFGENGKALAQYDAAEHPGNCRFGACVLGQNGTMISAGSDQDRPAFWVHDSASMNMQTKLPRNTQGYYFDAIQHGNFFYLCGQVQDPDSMNEILITKLDLNGNFVEDRTLGTSQNDGGIALASSGDKLMLLAYSYGKNLGDRDFWMMEIDENLDTLQSAVFGGAGYDQPACMLYEEGHFWLGGHSTSFNNNTNNMHDAYLLKVTPQLQVVWEKAYDFGDHEGIDRMLFLKNGNIGTVSYGDMMVQSGFYLEVTRSGAAVYQKRYPEIAGFTHLSEDKDRRVMWGITRGPIVDMARVSDAFPD